MNGVVASSRRNEQGSGPELITNGTFDNDVNGWSPKIFSSITIDWNPNGFMVLNDPTTGSKGAGQNIPIIINKTYNVKFRYANLDITNGSTVRLAIWIGNSLGDASEINKNLYFTGNAWRNEELTFTAKSTNLNKIIQFVCYYTSIVIDDVSVREVL